MNCATWGTLCNRWLLALAICLGTNTTLCAQSWNRAVSFGGVGSDFGIDIKINPAGDRYLTGNFSDSVTFGNKTLTSAGDTDIFLAKFGRWVVQIGGAEADQANDIALDGAGNVYLAGWFTDSATFHSTNGSTTTVGGIGATVFLAKYSSSGVLAWVQTGTVTSDFVNYSEGIAVDTGSGAVYWTGVSQGDTTFSSANGSVNSVPGPGTWHMYLAKYDANGNFQWGEWNVAAPNSIAHKVAVGGDGNVYVTGWFESVATFYSADGNDQTVIGLSEPVQTPPDYPGDAFVVKYDQDGNAKWVNDIGGYKAIGNDITVSSSGQVSITGLIGNIDGTAQQQETIVGSQPPGAAINLGGGIFTSPYNRDILVATYNESGVLLSAIRIGDADNQEGGAIIPSGNDLYVSGLYEEAGNVFVAKVTGGVLDWMVFGGGTVAGSQELTPRISLAPQGGIEAIGAFSGTATFGSFTLYSQGDEDVFLANLAP